MRLRSFSLRVLEKGHRSGGLFHWRSESANWIRGSGTDSGPDAGLVHGEFSWEFVTAASVWFGLALPVSVEPASTTGENH